MILVTIYSIYVNRFHEHCSGQGVVSAQSKKKKKGEFKEKLQANKSIGDCRLESTILEIH